LRIAVRFYASVREAVGVQGREFELVKGSRMEDLLMMLERMYPGMKTERRPLVAVNGSRILLDRRLEDGDIVAIYPPVSGG